LTIFAKVYPHHIHDHFKGDGNQQDGGDSGGQGGNHDHGSTHINEIEENSQYDHQQI